MKPAMAIQAFRSRISKFARMYAPDAGAVIDVDGYSGYFALLTSSRELYLTEGR